MSYLIRIHQKGVQHNDLEPRNVVISQSSGPSIIDFDNATIHHSCMGYKCVELIETAQRLGLDIGES